MRCSSDGRGRIGACSLVLATLLAVSGCAAWPWRAGPPLQEATVEQLTKLLEEREAAIQTMKGLFRAQISGPGIPIAQRVEAAMYYRRPHTFRLQGFNALGGPLFDFVLEGDLYRLRVSSMGQVFTGRVADLERVGKLGRPFQLSVLALSGVVAVAPVPKGEQMMLSEEGTRYRLELFASPASEKSQAGSPYRRLWFDRRSLQVVQEDRLTAAGDLEAMVRFEDFRPVEVPLHRKAGSDRHDAKVGSMLKPFKVTTEDGQGRGTLLLTFHEMVPNPKLGPEELGKTGYGGKVSSEEVGSSVKTGEGGEAAGS